MSTVIEAVDLYAGYGQTSVVKGVNITVRRGEFVALLGANGAGKTTTLMAMIGAIKAHSGSISALGASVGVGHTVPLARRGFAMVPENRGVFSQMTVEENLRLVVRKRDVEDALQYFPELISLKKRRAGLLSGGEQQMLALARAVASGPHLLIIDEMSLGLAPIVVQRLLPIVRSIVDDRGTAVLLVEQHLDLALSVADRAYVLSHGRMALEGVSADLLKRRDLLESSYLGDGVPL